MIDLHTHTTASDGTMSPRELVNHAREIGLKAVAITDHDTIAGVEEALEEGRRLGIRVIPGVEISVDYKKEMHILGYCLNINSEELLSNLQQLQEYRDQRNPMIVSKLNELGFKITLEEIEEEAGGDVIGRPHIAKVLLKKGYVSNLQEAFDMYLATGKPAYFKKERLSPHEAIMLIKKADGIPVLAHPKYLGLNRDELEELVVNLKEAGLMGIEVYYSTHSEEETEMFLAIANKFDLYVTGGSDFHGANKSEIKLGIGLGNLCVSDNFLNKLVEE